VHIDSVAMARPPGRRPIHIDSDSKARLPMPELSSTAPMKMKSGTAARE